MAVTIHYNGTLDDRARLEEMLDAARLFCAEQRWMYRDVDERILGTVEREVETAGATSKSGQRLTATFPIDDTLTGILITVHPEAEPVWLTFNAANTLIYYMPLNEADTFWELKALFTTTQKAGAAKHIAICELLHLLQDNYFPNLHVYDESGYFESGDEQELKIALRSLGNGANPFTGLPPEPEEESTVDAVDNGNEETSETDDEAQAAPKKKPFPRSKNFAQNKSQLKRGRDSGARKN